MNTNSSVIFIMMFWLVIFTAVLSAPVTKDPYDVISSPAQKKRNSNFGEDSGDSFGTMERDFVQEIIELLQERLKDSYQTIEKGPTIPKGEETKIEATEVEMIEFFKIYKLIKHKRESLNRNGLLFEEITDVIDASRTDIDEMVQFVNIMYDYLEANIVSILTEILTGNISKASTAFQVFNESIETVNLKLKPTVSGNADANTAITPNVNDKRRSIEETFPDHREMRPQDHVKDDTERGLSPGFNLQVMYEKHGGVCTLISGYSRVPILVISMCPLGFLRSDVKDLCEHIVLTNGRMHVDNVIDISQTPVQDAEGFVYRNMYCAQCNGVVEMKAWETKLDCDNRQPLSISDGSKEVTVLQFFDDKLQSCRRRLSPAYNKMIHECSHLDVINTMNMWYHQTRIGDAGKSEVSPFPLSFSILMNFGFDGKTHILFTSTGSQQTYAPQCGQNEKYDPVNSKCRPITCSEGYRLVQGSCQKIINYEMAPSADDLASLADIDEPVQVILTIKNFTFGDVVMLEMKGIEDILSISIAQTFNISFERIQNLTVSVVNTSDLVDKTGNNIIEIHRFTTPLPFKTHDVIDSNSIPRRKSDQDNLTSDHTPQKATENNTETVDVYVNNQEIKDNKSTMHAHLAGDSKPNNANADDEAYPKDNIAEMFNERYFSDQIQIAIRITFILNPSHKDGILIEKSVKTIVQTMSDLTDSNAFMLTINGKDFQVGHVDNSPPPTPISLFCPKGFHPFVDDAEFELERHFDAKNGQNVTAVRLKSSGQIYFPGDYDLTFNIDGSVGELEKMETQVSSFALICDMPKIVNKTCGRIVLNEHEYTLFSNKSIMFANHVYNTTEYEYENESSNTVFICSPDWLTAERLVDDSEMTMACGNTMIKLVVAESYLTFILGVISLVCMFSVLVTYSIFEKLRNLPGINTMNLTLSLFLGELLFIISGWVKEHHGWLCSCFGVILHYFFLASFFWMNVMAYDVFKTFAQKCILLRLREKRKYAPRYALYAWGCPLVIVGFCCLIDFGKIFDSIKIGYGGNSVADPEWISGVAARNEHSGKSNTTSSKSHVYSIGCWIQNPVASMVAFGGPMILILLINAVMFSQTIISIHASTKATRTSVRKSSFNRMTGKDDVMLYMRMSTVMGFTWVFGLASSLVSAFAEPASQTVCIILHLLGIFFIVFNCSQGIFIFFAFVFNRRVFAMYNGLVKRLKQGRHRPSSVSLSRHTITTVASQGSFSTIT
ncbi:uncharacterized protein LOC127831801 [Dreissena polymorpha]|uniref:G-protein coupled receptors family 2 profile 2 domain-containing protein n=1 Tax=Dreissena polymorpha TaxID=45954 RepID=A0A9D4GVB8_DREPO|nr:uncharacterized protein LOC127831801 [Dreissena polymorpha]KAH3823587.1 hypothetical protein DPMN_125395 [Dreissena polymorpha]